jgi:hypothetical protein
MRVARWIGNMLLIVCSVAVSALAAEYASRVIRPVAPTKWIDSQGQTLDLAAGKTKFWPQLPPGRVVRTITPEWDAVATIDSAGNRVPMAARLLTCYSWAIPLHSVWAWLIIRLSFGFIAIRWERRAQTSGVQDPGRSLSYRH